MIKLPQIAAIIFLILAISCKKGKQTSTIVRGKVFDSVTNQPVQGFVCGLSADQVADWDTSGVDGSYQLEVVDEWKYDATVWPDLFYFPETSYGKRYYYVEKMLPKDVEAGETTELNFLVDPKDAFLRVHLQNIHVHSGKFFADIEVPARHHGDYIYFDKILPLNDSILLEIPVAGMQTITFNVDSNYTGFDFKKIEATLVCPRHDTTDIWIKY